MRGIVSACARLAAGTALAAGIAASEDAAARTPSPLFRGVQSVAVLCRIEGGAADAVPGIADLCADAAGILRKALPSVPVSAIGLADVPQLDRGALIVGLTVVAERADGPSGATIVTLAVDLRRLPPVQPGLFDPAPVSLALPSAGSPADGRLDAALERLLGAAVGEPLRRARPG